MFVSGRAARTFAPGTGARSRAPAPIRAFFAIFATYSSFGTFAAADNFLLHFPALQRLEVSEATPFEETPAFDPTLGTFIRANVSPFAIAASGAKTKPPQQAMELGTVSLRRPDVVVVARGTATRAAGSKREVLISFFVKETSYQIWML
jgi:hypothetical protein